MRIGISNKANELYTWDITLIWGIAKCFNLYPRKVSNRGNFAWNLPWGKRELSPFFNLKFEYLLDSFISLTFACNFESSARNFKLSNCQSFNSKRANWPRSYRRPILPQPYPITDKNLMSRFSRNELFRYPMRNLWLRRTDWPI